MRYEINISFDGEHLFATHERSLTNEARARQVYNLFLQKFPKSKGYEIEMTLWNCTGTIVETTK